MEGVQAVWTPLTKTWLIVGIALMVALFGLDSSTIPSYSNYALSEFQSNSLQGTLGVTLSGISAVMKIPVAKFSDILGRGEVFTFSIVMFYLGFILHCAASSFGTFAAGTVFYAFGQASNIVLLNILVSDLTSMRIRALVLNLVFSPVLVPTWVAGPIVNSVVDGVGWRWGYGMFAIMMPIGGAVLIVALLHLQKKAKKKGLIIAKKSSIVQFCSEVDLGGLLLVSTGLTLFLIPVSLARRTAHRWDTRWISTSLAIGTLLMLCIWPYEQFAARQPCIRIQYFKTRAIILPAIMALFDMADFGATHTYLFPWSATSHNLSARDTVYLVSINSVAQCVSGSIAGAFMYKFRRYKLIAFLGACTRLLGYGVMVRLRNNGSSIAELFAVQIVQGLGSGMIEAIFIVAAQIVVPHAELAQVTAFVSMAFNLGAAIGAAIAGSIYTSHPKERLRIRLRSEENDTLVEHMFESISEPSQWGSPERSAVALAYSDVMGYITIAALALSIPVVLAAWFFPNDELG
ncbi:MFS siderochrome iron transporter C [Pseudocercospora fuligena]|uniref:MFS siderochrome iron transporter C n=1 Tax=Pseudocercospora fuligena TaxID=685502 RepID=A0A8H6RPJ3_9PEZI|nr:MFS siderochrome iron transporter C [Pseudocercospora fuligena]